MLFAAEPSNPAFNPVLVHDPVMLRPGTAADYPAWLALREKSRTHLTEWEESWSPEQATLSSFKRRLRTYDRDARRGAGLSLLVFRIDDNALVGGATLTNIRFGAARSGMLGYWIGAPFIRRGYGGAAVAAMKAHAFERLGLNRIVAACQPGNIASQKLLERNGFACEGLARDYLRINGVWRDHQIYAVTAADYREALSSLS
ncbi:GNAT family N-acetyltransferase [Hyphococcus sp.]|jgi:ribosomal-protein-alanine N-acetyltransferase|uniref:GNAT family N-acetyltransferase n=1 Tax=Hyphococcus sp. TaxID=2038636 RepID=UPI003D0EB0C3